MITNTTLAPVPFHSHTLFVVEHNGEPYTPMKPLVEAMGLAWQVQHRKLDANRDRWRITEMVIHLPGDDRARNHTCAPIRKLPGFLQTIHPNKVNKKIRERVVLFQNECDDALWAYWNEGRAVNPRQAQHSIHLDESFLDYLNAWQDKEIPNRVSYEQPVACYHKEVGVALKLELRNSKLGGHPPSPVRRFFRARNPISRHSHPHTISLRGQCANVQGESLKAFWPILVWVSNPRSLSILESVFAPASKSAELGARA